jgi:hypothetical protein
MHCRGYRVAVLTSILLGWFAGATRAEDPLGPPSGTLRVESREVAAGIGVTWGKGILTVDGVNHPFSVSGLSVADLGVARVTAMGEVYGLRKLEDFNGTYQGVTLGIAVGGGSEFVAMRNENGVYIKLRGGQQGVRLSLATNGTRLRLE